MNYCFIPVTPIPANPDIDSQKALNMVSADGLALQHLPPCLRNDPEIVLAAIRQNPTAFEFASFSLRGDRSTILAAVQLHPASFAYALRLARQTRSLVLEVVQLSGDTLQYTTSVSRNSREVVLSAVRQNGLALQHADPSLRCDKEIVLSAVRQNGLALQYADPSLRCDKKVVFSAIKQNGLALRYATLLIAPEVGIRTHHTSPPQHPPVVVSFAEEAALTAVLQNKLAILHAPPITRGRHSNKDTIWTYQDILTALALIKANPVEIQCHRWKTYKAFVLFCLQNGARVFPYLCDELRADPELVLETVQRWGKDLQYAAENLRADRDIVLTAVRQDGLALQYAKLFQNPEFQTRANDSLTDTTSSVLVEFAKEAILVAVNQNDRARRYIPPNIPTDFLPQSPKTLEAQNDQARRNVPSGIPKNLPSQSPLDAEGFWTPYACDSFRALIKRPCDIKLHPFRRNKHFVLRCIEICPKVFPYLDRDLQTDPEIIFCKEHRTLQTSTSSNAELGSR